MAPVFVRKLPVLAYRLDGGATWNGKPLFGKNKTVRGLLFGTIVAGIAGWLMQYLGLPFTWWWGFLLGFAALLGDSIKSMFKRQVGIKPGGRWMPFDQLDFIVAAFLMSLFFVRFSVFQVMVGMLIIFVGDVLVQLIGGWTKLKGDLL